MAIRFPRIFPILDASFIPSEGRDTHLDRIARSLVEAGALLLEYRNKSGTDAQALSDARILRNAVPPRRGRETLRLIMDDRVDVAFAAGFDGVHVDAGDLPSSEARRLLGFHSLIGTSANNEMELVVALNGPIDYIAFGPIFPTTTKQTEAVPIGIEGVRRFRSALTEAHAEDPGAEIALVAAAGITLETAQAIIDAGADSVAVAAAIFAKDDPIAEFRRWKKLLG